MMNISIDFNWKIALQAANFLVFQHTGKYLSDLEIIILRGAWDNCTYEQIAEAEGYTSSYLCRDVGCKLWANLSTALKEKVSKKNFKAALQREWKSCTQASLFERQTPTAKPITTENTTFSTGSVDLGSSLYLERSPIESICYETILKPGSLIRIKGAKWMGKTSLIDQILEQGNLHGQKTVYLDFANVERVILQNLDKLLHWLSVVVSQQLKFKNKVRAYWDTTVLNSDHNCTFYFEQYLLKETKCDVVLALDNLDRLFAHQEITIEFLKLLRSWHEKGKNNPLWSKLKLILAYSTSTYIPLNIDRSPFNAGVPILLTEFDRQQVKTLADWYQLDCDEFEISRLMNEVGGHPYLLKLAMYQIKAKNLNEYFQL